MAAATKEATKKCECGCGASTGSHFAPGHDSKHKSKLFDLAINGNPQQREKAKKEIKERNWTEAFQTTLNAKGSKFKPAEKKAAKKAPKKAAKVAVAADPENQDQDEDEDEEEPTAATS